MSILYIHHKSNVQKLIDKKNFWRNLSPSQNCKILVKKVLFGSQKSLNGLLTNKISCHRLLSAVQLVFNEA